MGERVSGEAALREPAHVVASVLADISSYPHWNTSILSAQTLRFDDRNRPLEASFVIDIKLAKIEYTLAYTYDDPVVRWSLVTSDLLTQFDGEYRITYADDITVVQYSIDVDVRVALPAVMKRRAAEMMLQQTLTGLKARCAPAEG